MPVRACQLQGRPGFKWGNQTCYTYDPDDTGAKERAFIKAAKQGRAIRARQRADAPRLAVAADMVEPVHLERKYRAALLRRTRLMRDLLRTRLAPILRESRDVERRDAVIDFSTELLAALESIQMVVDQIAPIDEAELAALAASVEGWATRQVERSLQPVVPGIRVFTEATEGLYSGFIADNVALIKSIDERYFEQVAEAIQVAAREGQTTKSLSAEIQRRFQVSQTNADRVARDQVAKLNGQVTQHRQQQLGVTEYMWQTAGDERVTGAPGGRYADERPSHYALDGTIQRWDRPPNAARGGGPAHPGEAINCRCRARAVMDEEQRARLMRESEQRQQREAATQASVLGAPGRAQ